MLNKLVLGTAQMGLDYGINNHNGKASLSECFRILEWAFDNDIYYLDTAEVYGDAHKIIGDFHRSHTGMRFRVITKIPHDFKGNLNQKVNLYLNELSTDSIETLLFHSFHAYIENRNLIDSISEKIESGVVKNVGVSVYTNEEMEVLLGHDSIKVIQLPFNLFDNLSRRGDILRRAKKKGKTIQTRSSFLQGLFYMKIEEDNVVIRPLRSQLIEINRIALRNNLSVSQIALNYCLHQPHIDYVLVGVDRLQQLVENVNGLLVEFPEQIMEEINSIKISDSRLINPMFWKI